MITSSSVAPYYHPLVYVMRPEARYDYGWYSHVFHDCDSRDLTIERVHIPKHVVEGASIQQKFLT
jgi:hypothetical protein